MITLTRARNVAVGLLVLPVLLFVAVIAGFLRADALEEHGLVVAAVSLVVATLGLVWAIRKNRQVQQELDAELANLDGLPDEVSAAEAAYVRFSQTMILAGALVHAVISLINQVMPAPAHAFLFWLAASLMIFLGFPTASRQHFFVHGARARKLKGDV